RETADCDSRGTGGSGCAIISLAVGYGSYGDGSRSNIGRGSGSGVRGIVASVGACNGNTTHRNCLGCPNILIGEGRAGITISQHVAGYAIVGKCHGGRRGAVIGPVYARGAHGQCPG